jgi:hypothetical protein
MNQVSWDLHIENCCAVHGCKYGEEDCPIAAHEEVQKNICSTCSQKGIQSISHLHRVMGGVETVLTYQVEVQMNPNDAILMNPYHWTILVHDKGTWRSVEEGHEDSPYRAFEEAERKHKEFLEREQKEFMEGEESE